ncbi:hypothetical protein FYK55_09970 [Roseiconus nitratireducens]|uniref:Uncharacterized protein n=1 Tax=Roseiconus nitratireducens TaxID=2605748 RepID=A0A5M6DDV6_9BACT|nr:hypothetical protein [Roseiconus nitratireducens]KAA5544626.1 hypothetical protein FYK55_09970 [Roseiconus nitratireducens]
MIHYTCDRCKRTIDPETETRYVVEIEVRAVTVETPATQTSDELDQLAELHDQLQRELNADLEGIDEELDLNFDGRDGDGPESFDLCPQCHEVFSSNPLGREIAVGYGFSNN